MTNRLPPQTMSFDDFMTEHMADFGKRLIQAGRSREDARRWILDRFDDTGKYNLKYVDTDYILLNMLTDEAKEFRIEPQMVFVINHEALQEFLREKFDSLHDDVKQTLGSYLRLLAEAKMYVVWKLCLMLSDGSLPTAMGVFSFSEVSEGKQIMAGVAAPVLVSMITYLMSQGVMVLAGRWENEVG